MVIFLTIYLSLFKLRYFEVSVRIELVHRVTVCYKNQELGIPCFCGRLKKEVLLLLLLAIMGESHTCIHTSRSRR